MNGRDVADRVIQFWGLILASAVVALTVVYLWGAQIAAWWQARAARMADIAALNRLWEVSNG